MKKFVIVAATVFAAAAVFTGGIAAGTGGKVIAEGFSCGILDGAGGVYVTNNSQLILYQTKAVLRCQGNNGVGANPGPIFWNNGNTGLSCGMLEFGSTTNWSDKVGYNGDSQLTCTQALDARNGDASGGAGIG
jgi:hypothetical protein